MSLNLLTFGPPVAARCRLERRLLCALEVLGRSPLRRPPAVKGTWRPFAVPSRSARFAFFDTRQRPANSRPPRSPGTGRRGRRDRLYSTVPGDGHACSYRAALCPRPRISRCGCRYEFRVQPGYRATSGEARADQGAMMAQYAEQRLRELTLGRARASSAQGTPSAMPPAADLFRPST